MARFVKHLALASLFSFLVVLPSFAATFTGKFVDVEDKVTLTLKIDGNQVQAQIGMTVHQGDKIVTGSDGVAEILFEDGNVTVLDEDTTLVIAQLKIAKNKQTETILDLAIGRVKSSVVKLVNTRAKFEIHTKSAVAGVTGTPPFVMEASRTPGGKIETKVDLMTRGKDKGGLFVRGTGKEQKRIVLTPGKRTIVRQGRPPANPFNISPLRMKNLRRALPIKTKPETQTEKRKEMKKKVEEVIKKEEEKKPEEEKAAEEEKVAEEEKATEEAAPEEEKAAEEEKAKEEKAVEEEKPKEEKAAEEEKPKEEKVAEAEKPKEEKAKEEVKKEEVKKEEVKKKAVEAPKAEAPKVEAPKQATVTAPSSDLFKDITGKISFNTTPIKDDDLPDSGSEKTSDTTDNPSDNVITGGGTSDITTPVIQRQRAKVRVKINLKR